MAGFSVNKLIGHYCISILYFAKTFLFSPEFQLPTYIPKEKLQRPGHGDQQLLLFFLVETSESSNILRTYVAEQRV